MWIVILVAVVAVLLILYIKFYNRLQRLSVKVQEGSAGIDVALEKRYDMLSEEIEAVKKYLAHEYQIYTEVTSTRAGKELNESIFQEKKQLSEEAVKAISETIAEQQKQMETGSSWISSEGRITLLERKHQVWEATGCSDIR